MKQLFPDAGETVMTGQNQVVQFGGVETDPVIFDTDAHIIADTTNSNTDVAGSGVGHNVPNQFTDTSKKQDLHVI